MRSALYIALAIGLLFLAGLLASMSLGLGASTTVETITTLGQTFTVTEVEPGASVTVTLGGQARTVTTPGPGFPVPGQTRTVVKIVAGPTKTVAGPTQTVAGPTRTVPGPTQTVTHTVTGPAQTVTVAGPTQTVTQNVAGPTQTVTQTVVVTVPGGGGPGGPNCPPRNPHC